MLSCLSRNCGRRIELLFAVALAVGLTIVGYWGVWDCGFVNFDDGTYVTDNPRVREGLTADNFRWAWTTFRASNWHPLTWLSLQLDARLCGPEARGFHCTNLAMHCVAGLLAILVCRRLWNSIWPGALVAVLFLVHPLHVESVAWISERKDVLSTLLGLLAVIAYCRYAERPSPGRYCLVMAAFALSLLAKPMLVTLPCLWLLWDWWPLERTKSAMTDAGRSATFTWRRLVLEKIPFFGLAAVSCLLTVQAQHGGGALRTFDDVGLAYRCANAVAGYAFYSFQAIWPHDLIVFYPPPSSYPLSQTIGWTLAGTSATAVFFALRRRWPGLLFGWFWFLGTLVPVIGLVQVGAQAYADRYSYFPLIGLCIVFATGILALSRLPMLGRTSAIVLCCGAVAACVSLTRNQLQYWRNGTTLWEHALAVTPDNYCAHRHLADLLAQEGRLDEAIEHAKRAVANWPYQISHVHLAELLVRGERFEEAIEQYRLAVRDEPADADSHLMLGNLLLRQRRLAAAIEQFAEALAWRGGWADAQNGLGTAHALNGDQEASLGSFRAAVAAEPGNATYHNNLGQLLAKKGDAPGALAAFQHALTIDPKYAQAYDNRGHLFAWLGRWSQAALDYRKAVEHDGRLAAYQFDLAVALDERGQTTLARRRYQAAVELDPSWPRRAADEAWRLATAADAEPRDPARAIRLAKQARLSTAEPTAAALDVLAAAYADAGRFEEAAAVQSRAVNLAELQGDSRVVDALRRRLRMYQNHEPYRTSQFPISHADVACEPSIGIRSAD